MNQWLLPMSVTGRCCQDRKIHAEKFNKVIKKNMLKIFILK